MRTKTKNKALEYAEGVISGEIHAPKYVKIQCKQFKRICDGKDEKYFLNEKRLDKINTILKVLVMAKGPSAGKPIYKSLAGYQWLFVVSVLCVVHREDPRIRRYQTALLEICRKNGKTFIVALLFLLLFYLEPSYSKFYSVAPDGSLAREIKEALEPLIDANRDVLEENEIIVRRDYILHSPTKTKYIPLNYSVNRMDGKEPNVFIADEVGALPTIYPVEAMRSGQLLVKNRLGFIISTKYPTADNPFEDEVDTAKKVLDGIIEDETLFALLYEPDDTKNWMTNDEILFESNPLAIEIDEVMQDLKKKRQSAIEREKLRENFLTKHCNIIYQGAGTETYIDVNLVQACKADKIDWKGREVYLGVDLSMTSDNTAVAMVSDDNGTILADVIAFVPEGRIEEKNQTEKVDYRRFINELKCIACGDLTIDYSVVEQFVMNIEKKYGVSVVAIGYDRYNCLSSAQKWEEHNLKTVEIRQHSSVLHSPTKLLSEKITNKEFKYEKNSLLEINFQNARCTYDTNMNRYVNKKKSSGKIDMVVALINATFLLEQDVYLNNMSFVAQVI